MTAPQRVIVTVHGIRTFGEWQLRLRNLVKENSPETVVVSYGYGYFSVIAFIIPIFRWLAVRAFRMKMLALARAHPDARFSFVAHSFGTHIVIYGLRGLGREAPYIDTIVLSGSVLRSQFDWDNFRQRIPTNRVINDCGVNDVVLVFSQLLVLFTGMAGRAGFYGFSGETVINRFFAGGHSHYFQPAGSDPDAFMRRFWLPLLIATSDIDLVQDRPNLTVLDGIYYAVLRVADPLKIGFYVLLFWLAFDFLYFQPRLQAQAEQASREIAAAANLIEADRALPDAFASMARLLATDAAPREAQQAEAANLARYTLQRLTPFDSVYRAVSDGDVFRWRGNVYLKAAFPIRLDFPILSYASFPALRRLVTLSADSTVRVLDMDNGATITSQQFSDGDGLVTGDIVYDSLPGITNTIAMQFSFEDPNADDVDRWTIAIDLRAPALSSLHNALTADPDCTGFRSGSSDDDEDLSAPEIVEMRQRLSEEREIAENCFRQSNGARPIQLPFPSSIPEADTWAAATDATPFPEEEMPNGCPNFSGVQGQIMENPAKLDFSRFEGEVDEFVEKSFAEPDPDMLQGCVIMFTASTGKEYVVTYGFVGQWYVGYILCEVGVGDRVRTCVYPSFAWNGNGELTLSDDGRFLTLAGYGSQEGTFWSLIDLEHMEIIDPEEELRTATVTIVIGGRSDIVMVLTLVPDQPGAVEAWFYRIGQKPVLTARRVFAAQAGFALVDENGRNLADETIALRNGDSFVIATPFQQLFAVRLDNGGALPRWLAAAWRAVTLQPPQNASVVLDWAVPDAGFGPYAPVKYVVSQVDGIAAVYSSSELRLLNLTNGRFLSLPLSLATLMPCSGGISSVAIETPGTVVAKLDGCIARRTAPIPLASLVDRAGDFGKFIGEGDATAPKLPGETSPPR